MADVSIVDLAAEMKRRAIDRLVVRKRLGAVRYFALGELLSRAVYLRGLA